MPHSSDEGWLCMSLASTPLPIKQKRAARLSAAESVDVWSFPVNTTIALRIANHHLCLAHASYYHQSAMKSMHDDHEQLTRHTQEVERAFSASSLLSPTPQMAEATSENPERRSGKDTTPGCLHHLSHDGAGTLAVAAAVPHKFPELRIDVFQDEAAAPAAPPPPPPLLHRSPPKIPFRTRRRLPSVLLDSWEFRKLAAEGSVLPNALVSYDVDDDGIEEVIVGTTEGLLCVVKPDCRVPLFMRVMAATISVVLYAAHQSRLVLITLEGQCEVVDNFLVSTPLTGGGEETSNASAAAGSHRVSTTSATIPSPSAGRPSAPTRAGSRAAAVPPAALPRGSSHTCLLDPAAPAAGMGGGSAALQPSHVFHIPSNCLCADLSTEAEANLLFLGSYDRQFYIYSITSGACLVSFYAQDPITSIRAFTIPTHATATNLAASSAIRVQSRPSAPSRPGHRGGTEGKAMDGAPVSSSAASCDPTGTPAAASSDTAMTDGLIPLVFLSTTTHLVLLPAGLAQIQRWRRLQPKSIHLPLTLQLSREEGIRVGPSHAASHQGSGRGTASETASIAPSDLQVDREGGHDHRGSNSNNNNSSGSGGAGERGAAMGPMTDLYSAAIPPVTAAAGLSSNDIGDISLNLATHAATNTGAAPVVVPQCDLTPSAANQTQRQTRRQAIQAAEMGRPVLVTPFWVLRIGRRTLEVPVLEGNSANLMGRRPRESPGCSPASMDTMNDAIKVSSPEQPSFPAFSDPEQRPESGAGQRQRTAADGSSYLSPPMPPSQGAAGAVTLGSLGYDAAEPSCGILASSSSNAALHPLYGRQKNGLLRHESAAAPAHEEEEQDPLRQSHRGGNPSPSEMSVCDLPHRLVREDAPSAATRLPDVSLERTRDTNGVAGCFGHSPPTDASMNLALGSSGKEVLRDGGATVQQWQLPHALSGVSAETPITDMDEAHLPTAIDIAVGPSQVALALSSEDGLAFELRFSFDTGVPVPPRPPPRPHRPVVLYSMEGDTATAINPAAPQRPPSSSSGRQATYDIWIPSPPVVRPSSAATGPSVAEGSANATAGQRTKAPTVPSPRGKAAAEGGDAESDTPACPSLAPLETQGGAVMLRVRCLWATHLSASPLVQRTRIFLVREEKGIIHFCTVFVAANGTCVAVDGDTLSAVEYRVREDCSSFTLMTGSSSTSPLLPIQRGGYLSPSAITTAATTLVGPESRQSLENTVVSNTPSFSAMATEDLHFSMLHGLIDRRVSCVCVSVDDLCVYSVGNAYELVQSKQQLRSSLVSQDDLVQRFRETAALDCQSSRKDGCQGRQTMEPDALEVAREAKQNLNTDNNDNEEDEDGSDGSAETSQEGAIDDQEELQEMLWKIALDLGFASSENAASTERETGEHPFILTREAAIFRVQQMLLHGYTSEEWGRLQLLLDADGT